MAVKKEAVKDSKMEEVVTQRKTATLKEVAEEIATRNTATLARRRRRLQ